MKREVLNKYCVWLFDVLRYVEERLDISGYDAFQARVFGRISELLINVWVLSNDISFLAIKVSYMEYTNLIRQSGDLIKRKYKELA
jgi:hypothetical protein